MKKLLLALVAVIVLAAVAAVGAPVWFGMQAESLYHERIAQLQKDGLTSVSYERGLFSSTAQTQFQPPGLPVAITGKHHITHGPIDWSRGADAVFSPVLALVDSELTAKMEAPGAADLPLGTLPIRLHTVVDPSGGGQTTLQTPAGKKGVIEWKAVTGELSFDGEGKALKANLRAPEISVGAVVGKAVVSGVSVDVDLQTSPSGNLLGDANIAVANIAAEPVFRMEGFSLRTRTGESAGNLNASVRYRVNTLRVGPEQVGPALLEFEVRKLDAKSVAKLDQTLKDLQQRQMPEEQRAMIMTGHLLDIVGDLAAKAPELELTKLSVAMPAGEITGRGKLVLDGSNMNVKENPMLLVNALSAEGEIRIPAAVLQAFARMQVEKEIMGLKASGKLSADEQAKLTPQKVAAISSAVVPQRANAMAQKMRLVQKDADYVLVATLKRGQVRVNGLPLERPLPLPK